jgi:hypothetical protein
MIDPLSYFLPILESPDTLIGAHEVRRWPAGVLERLINLGLLVRAEDAYSVVCPECGDHTEDLIAEDGPGYRVRFFIECPEVWRLEVPATSRKQWRPNLEAFVRLMSVSLKLSGKPASLHHDRLWRIGRMTWNGQGRDVLFVRGLRWDDGDLIRRAISRARRPIVFSSTYAMPDDFWPTVPPQSVLRDVASLEDDFQVDVVEITVCLDDAANRRTGEPLQPITREELTLMVRRQVKAEHKTELTDEFYLRAYRQEGSVRKAADYLTQATGQTISKDAVQRAVNRHGGASAVLESEDSNSIVRGVASQQRDRKGKKLSTEKP